MKRKCKQCQVQLCPIANMNRAKGSTNSCYTHQYKPHGPTSARGIALYCSLLTLPLT